MRLFSFSFKNKTEKDVHTDDDSDEFALYIALFLNVLGNNKPVRVLRVRGTRDTATISERRFSNIAIEAKGDYPMRFTWSVFHAPLLTCERRVPNSPLP